MAPEGLDLERLPSPVAPCRNRPPYGQRNYEARPLCFLRPEYDVAAVGTRDPSRERRGRLQTPALGELEDDGASEEEFRNAFV